VAPKPCLPGSGRTDQPINAELQQATRRTPTHSTNGIHRPHFVGNETDSAGMAVDGALGLGQTTETTLSNLLLQASDRSGDRFDSLAQSKPKVRCGGCGLASIKREARNRRSPPLRELFTAAKRVAASNPRAGNGASPQRQWAGPNDGTEPPSTMSPAAGGQYRGKAQAHGFSASRRGGCGQHRIARRGYLEP